MTETIEKFYRVELLEGIFDRTAVYQQHFQKSSEYDNWRIDHTDAIQFEDAFRSFFMKFLSKKKLSIKHILIEKGDNYDWTYVFCFKLEADKVVFLLKFC